MSNPTLTVEQVLGFRPCYVAERIRELAKRRATWTLLDVLRMRSVPDADKVWLATRPGVLTPQQRLSFTQACVLDACVSAEAHQQQPAGARAIELARQWATIGNLSARELRTAAAAAYAYAASAASAADAADAAAAYAAAADADAADAAAAYAAAYAAASAADAAAASAADAAAAYAASAAARKDARQRQVQTLTRLVGQ